MAATRRPIIPNDPAYEEELDPALRERKFEDEFEESSDVEPSSDELDEPDVRPG